MFQKQTCNQNVTLFLCTKKKSFWKTTRQPNKSSRNVPRTFLEAKLFAGVLLLWLKQLSNQVQLKFTAEERTEINKDLFLCSIFI